MKRINYGINRRRPESKRKKDIEHAQGYLTVEDDEDHCDQLRIVQAHVKEAHPGWYVTGIAEHREGE